MPKSEIQAFKRKTGFEWTEEFFDFYTRHDGVGMMQPGNEKVNWSFVPTSEVCIFVDSIRKWFTSTHPEIARAFFPFFDWGSGDAVGYFRLSDILREDVDEIVPGTLFEFEHECYEFDPSQPWTDFLQPAYGSIRHFLK